MAVRIAGSDRSRRRTSTRRRRLTVAGVLIVVVIIAAVAWWMGVFTFGNKKVAATPTPTLTTGAKQAEDVGLVAGAVGQYAAANDALPLGLATVPGNGLVLCGTTCSPTNYDVSGFSFYQASDVRLMPYSMNLAAPNQSAIYLVPGAKCGTDGQVGAANPGPRSMVLLYDSESDSGTTLSPRCIVL